MPANAWVWASRKVASAVVALALCCVAMPALADIPGQGASAFRDAVAAWLAEEEETALAELAALAQDGSAAAQMLLGLIDKAPALQGAWLSRQPRDARLALMRAPGGMSGRSWMHDAAEQTPEAELWLRLWRVDAPLDLPLAFAEAGETRAARESLVVLSARERRGFATMAEEPDYPHSMRFLVWREWLEAPNGAERVRKDAAKLAPGDPQRAHVGDPPGRDTLADWLMSAPEAAGIAILCTERCGAAPRDCALAAHDALASHRGLLTFGSPSEALIPAADFHASPKGQSSLLRRILLASDARGRRAQFARAEAQDSCLAGLLQAEAQRYMPRRD